MGIKEMMEKGQVTMTVEEYERGRMQIKREIRLARAKDRQYFRKQKIFALLIILFGLLIVMGGEWLEWYNFKFMGDCLVAAGIYTAITDKRLIVE